MKQWRMKIIFPRDKNGNLCYPRPRFVDGVEISELPVYFYMPYYSEYEEADESPYCDRPIIVEGLCLPEKNIHLVCVKSD
jgi:hypothetical protein